ncbi:C-C motif chemokine 22-like [Emydura macquarii macquarii]|uniref:C-C motif chemokine 22-like n=1 Tax=Emydura macquarii macquarii TaxID=1129001 RepID=UPI00352A0C21
MNCLTTAFLAILLLGLSLQRIRAAPQGILEDTICCTDVIKTPIRRGNLRSFYRTSPGCRIPAVVFVTHHNKEVCADLKTRWAQNAMRYLQKTK